MKSPTKSTPQTGAASKREVFLIFLLTISVLVNSRVSKNILQSLRFPFPPKPHNIPLQQSVLATNGNSLNGNDPSGVLSDKAFRQGGLTSSAENTLHAARNNDDPANHIRGGGGKKHNGTPTTTAQRASTHLKEPKVLPQPTFHGLYHNKHQVVHVIHTRFMQHQAHLDHLARGRLKLFQTITLPSLLNQSNKDFLWIIWLEPQLEESIKRQLLEMLRKVREKLSILVIGSSDAKLPDLRSTYYEDLLESSIYLGDPLILDDYREAAQTRVLLDTTLDSDDAVFLDFVATMQSEAAKTLSVTSLETGDYRYWCASQSLYWQYYDPWKKGPKGTPSKRGALVSVNHMKSDKECPVGGFTKGYAVGTNVEDLPQALRHEIHTKAVSCDYVEHKCIRRWEAGAAEFAVLRTRTPLAVGVADVLATLSHPSSKLLHNTLQNRQNQMWSRVETYFGITQKSVVAMRAALELDMLPMILDSMQGICMPGHSCKRQDKDALKTLKLKYKYPSSTSPISSK